MGQFPEWILTHLHFDQKTGQYPLTHFHFTQNNFSFEAKENIESTSIWKLKCKTGQFPEWILTHFHFTQNNFSLKQKKILKYFHLCKCRIEDSIKGGLSSKFLFSLSIILGDSMNQI